MPDAASKPHVILVTECGRFAPAAAELLRNCGTVILSDLDRAGLLSQAESASVLWVRLRHLIDAEVLASAPHLQYIATPTTGLTHIDLNSADRLGIRIISLQGESEFLRGIRATAEHTVNLMLSLLRRTPTAVQHVAAGGWNRDAFLGLELYGKRVGLVGLGRLGCIMVQYLRAFGCEVIGYDPDEGAAEASGARPVSFDQLLSESDIISLHAAYTRDQQGWFDAACFKSMKTGSFFINTARGELVDEAALLEALETGHLAGAALDVLSGEDSSGMGGHALVQWAIHNPNLLITPHIGGCTRESMEKTELFLAEKLCRTLREDQARVRN